MGHEFGYKYGNDVQGPSLWKDPIRDIALECAKSEKHARDVFQSSGPRLS